MATAAILDFGFIAISRPPIIRFWPNLVRRCRFWLRPRKFIQNLNFSKFKMADGSYLENKRNVITSRNIDRFARNLVCGRILSLCGDLLTDTHIPYWCMVLIRAMHAPSLSIAPFIPKLCCCTTHYLVNALSASCTWNFKCTAITFAVTLAIAVRF